MREILNQRSFQQGFEKWNSRNWQTIDAHVLFEFPKYSIADLFMITLGPYQLKMAEGYFLEHSSVDGSFYIQVQRDSTSISEKADSLSMEVPILIRARIQSRHSNATNCCAHSATLVWYLGWARYAKDLHLPSVPMQLLETHHWTDEDE
uniref:Uncharacterized protein n=1 Tax=Tetranychus urticae TaxID=32264 RepID=T1K185_TETUR